MMNEVGTTPSSSNSACWGRLLSKQGVVGVAGLTSKRERQRWKSINARGCGRRFARRRRPSRLSEAAATASPEQRAAATTCLMSTEASTWASVFASYSAYDSTDIPGNVIFLQRLVIFHLRRQKLPGDGNKSDGKIVSYQSFNSIRQEMNWQDSRTHLVRRLSREDSRALTSENLTSLCQREAVYVLAPKLL